MLKRIRMNHKGVVSLLNSSPVWSDLRKRGNAIHAALPKGNGEEWVVETATGRDRAGVKVGAANPAALNAAAENFALQRAIDAGR